MSRERKPNKIKYSECKTIENWGLFSHAGALTSSKAENKGNAILGWMNEEKGFLVAAEGMYFQGRHILEEYWVQN